MISIDDVKRRAQQDAKSRGIRLTPDEKLLHVLLEGLKTNEERYGYQSCPCRLAEGVREKDLDIICPCDYRDPDLDEYGACYCALYVSEEIATGEKDPEPVPERRGAQSQAADEEHNEELVGFTTSGIPVWRCKVCGYLCARPQHPLKCPVCKADKDRFERFA